MLIGLSGFAEVGKDTAASFLVDHLGYERRAFADKVRDVYYGIDPYVLVSSVSDERIDRYYARVGELVDKWGWSEAKKVPDVRQGLQRVGDTLRHVFGERVLLDACLRGATERDKIVVTDCRHVIEAEAIRALRGHVIRLERPDYGPVNNHATETTLTNYSHFTATIHNDSTIEQLGERIVRVVEELICACPTP